MAASSPLTPRRVYCRLNMCLLCGFSFIQTEIDSHGEKVEKKLFKEKLKLTVERIGIVKEVLPKFEVASQLDDNNGICIRCFKKVQKVIKQQGELNTLISTLNGSRSKVENLLLSLPSPKKLKIEKRLLRSPSVDLPAKKQLTNVIVVRPTKIPDIFKQTDKNRVGQSSTSVQDFTDAFIPLAPKPATSASVTHVEPKKKVRRSLGFAGKENQPISEYEGEVQLTVHYPSGSRSTYVYSESHKKICKAIQQGSNVEKVIIDTIVSSNPVAIATACAKIIREECAKICKRGSGSVLQKKEADDFLDYQWQDLYSELGQNCPALLTTMTSVVADKPPVIGSKAYHHLLLSAAIGLHGRSQEMSAVQYMIGFVLTPGGCTLRDIERLSSIGLTVHPKTVQNRVSTWQDNLDKEIISLRDSWSEGGKKYQLIGDNWDKNILPSYRTSAQKTLSVHLFNLIAVVDRITPQPLQNLTVIDISEIDISTYIPSIQEQEKLMTEMTFIFATSLIQNVPQIEKLFKGVYPKHLEHKYSEFSGIKTVQYPLGLYNCNENKTQELIQLLKDLTQKYVPFRNGELYEAVLFGGDRLTDERVQSAQTAMKNEDSPKNKLEGFISKIEDFHRLMNFLEAICKLTYSSESAQDKGTAFYYRNLLNLRNVKGKVKNAYRPYKLLYYTILDAMFVLLFLSYFDVADVDTTVPLPVNFEKMTSEEKISWLNDTCSSILREHFFDGKIDICSKLRDILQNPDHEENYWTRNLENGRVKCHFCQKTYAYIGSLKAHEKKVHNLVPEKPSRKVNPTDKDQVQEYFFMMFKLILLHKNLDSAVDMGDGERSVRSAKYELPIYNKTNKTKYSIGSIHLTAISSGLLLKDQEERLVNNRFINLQGGKNNNVALDEFVEMLNRDSKVACSGHQTVDSIVQHSKEYPHIINMVKHFDDITDIHQRKGFHHLPSYKEDVLKILKDLQQVNPLQLTPGRSFKCKELSAERNPYDNSFKGLSTMIHRHRPSVPFRRLRDAHV